MKIDFRVISHAKQRYDSCGDYFRQNGGWSFRVSRTEDRRYCWLVFLHEVIEWAICRLTGVSMKAIDKFDRDYEKARSYPAAPFSEHHRAPCSCVLHIEPGDDPHAPYHRAHQTATACEKLIAEALGVNWAEYDETVGSL